MPYPEARITLIGLPRLREVAARLHFLRACSM
jgi:hypothetical protein